MRLEVYQKSVTYDGVEYFLHDCVTFYRAGDTETSIGKIVKIIDTADGGKKLKVVWFFRPSEIRDYLGDYEPRWNEIFLASGEGKGLSDTNFLEAVLGKCTVVCISMDQRNHLPSETELRSADYNFSRTFDVGKLTISKKFPDRIEGFRVENFFNQRKNGDLNLPPIQKPHLTYPTENSNSLSKKMFDKVVDSATDDWKCDDKDLEAKNCRQKRTSSSYAESQVGSAAPTKVRCPANLNAQKTSPISEDKIQERIPSTVLKENVKQNFSEHFPYSTPVKPEKKVKFSGEVNIQVIPNRDQMKLEPPALSQVTYKGKSSNEASPLGEWDHATKKDSTAETKPWFKNSNEASPLGEWDHATKTDSTAETKPWFKKTVTPWKERLQKAQERGTLVLLENLDPTCSSSEVEEMVHSAFKERVEAKMIVQTPPSCHLYGRSRCSSGKAFVIFESSYAAHTVIRKLKRGCLLLTGGRPVLGTIGAVEKPPESKLFVGHYKVTPKRVTEDMRNAVASSHCSQKNTMDYSMAWEWHLLQEKSGRWWKQLHEKQAKEMMELKQQLRIKI